MGDLAKQMSSLRDAAKSGQFSVNDEGGRALLGAIQDMQEWVNTEMQDARQLDRDGQYGTSHGAAVVEPYMNKVATDQDGYVPMIGRFADVLNDARSAIHEAMGNYRATEDSNQTGVSRLQAGMPNAQAG